MTAVEERPAAAEPAPAPGRLRALWQGPVGFCVRVYLVARVALSLVAVFAAALIPVQPSVGVPGWDPVPWARGWSNAVTGFERADALWYLRIASEGYRVDDASGAFFPLYPYLAKGVGLATGGRWLLGAYVVSNLAVVAALVLLHRLTALEVSEAAARRVVVLAVVFPTGFFLFAPYTEALFLALVLGALYAARRERWAWAAVLAALAALARSSGVLLGVVLGIEALLQVRSLGGPAVVVRALLRRAPAVLAGPLALVGYLAAWQVQGGDWRRPVDLQSTNWGKERALPWETLQAGWQAGIADPGGYLMVDLVFVLLALAACGWLVVRVRPTYSAYALLSVLFPMLYMFGGRPLMSLPRYLAVVFPLLWALDRLGQRYGAFQAVVAVSGACCAALAALFVQSYGIY